ncbi:hypothetical protein [Muricoccus pecuniae]|uniref:Uncharacterized protein n=1 Tax=Muricoccus pecuniae TaxID=693023 RepID=A0A840Y245_9PROT|nr:hypothetical protein [Roseomonas pecuniae]MBB5692879.1 hypothetical protein [Roseomonas pecuniae]
MHRLLLILVAFVPALGLLGIFLLLGRVNPEWTGLALLLHLLVLPPLLWWVGRRLSGRARASPSSRADLMVAVIPTVLMAWGFGRGIVGALAFVLIAAIPFAGLWLGLGLNRREAKSG